MMCMIFTMLYLLIYKYMTNVGTVLEIVWKGFYSGCGEGLTAKIMFWEKTTCLEYLETQIVHRHTYFYHCDVVVIVVLLLLLPLLYYITHNIIIVE